MSDSVIISLVGLVVSGVCLPVIKYLFGRIKDVEGIAISALDKLNQLKLHVAENYTSLKRFEGFETALFKKLDTIEEKLDHKADK